MSDSNKYYGERESRRGSVVGEAVVGTWAASGSGGDWRLRGKESSLGVAFKTISTGFIYLSTEKNNTPRWSKQCRWHKGCTANPPRECRVPLLGSSPCSQWSRPRGRPGLAHPSRSHVSSQAGNPTPRCSDRQIPAAGRRSPLLWLFGPEHPNIGVPKPSGIRGREEVEDCAWRGAGDSGDHSPME